VSKKRAKDETTARLPGYVTAAFARRNRRRAKAKASGKRASGGARRVEKSGTMSEGACVATVTVKGTGEEPGVAEVGETVQVDWLGAPVQASETALENPFIPETRKLYRTWRRTRR